MDQKPQNIPLHADRKCFKTLLHVEFHQNMVALKLRWIKQVVDIHAKKKHFGTKYWLISFKFGN